MKTQPLRLAAEVTLGRMRNPSSETGPNQTPYLRAANVRDGELVLKDIKMMHFDQAEQVRYSLRSGDVLVTEASGSRAQVGQTAMWDASVPGVAFQNTLVRLRARPGTHPRFLYWWSRHAHGSGLYGATAQGLAIWHLSSERVRPLPFPCLSIFQQGRTADFLDVQVGLVDQAIRMRHKQRIKIAQRSDTRVSWLLTNPRLPGGGSRANYPWLRDDGASFMKLAWVADLQSGLTIDAQRAGSVEYPYLSVANVQSDRLDLSVVKTVKLDPRVAARFMLRSGDVLVTEGGDLDKLGRGTVWRGEIDPCLHQNHVFALRPHPDRLLPEYLAALTRTHHARRYFEITGSRSTNLASTNSSKVLGFRFPLPDVARQRQILDELQLAEQDDAALDAALERQIALLQERKQALITAAVTGQFDVTTARKVSTT
ncbi:hypothetical protein AB2L28_09850 [Kineococcus sp. TBRC 1896]|uniref:Type I restriction enzyme S subunit n=1 Tax=Kineococcus mangrovi TaxID=1660183 RepID=A0ABV4I1J0_9ACTN